MVLLKKKNLSINFQRELSNLKFWIYCFLFITVKDVNLDIYEVKKSNEYPNLKNSLLIYLLPVKHYVGVGMDAV